MHEDGSGTRTTSTVTRTDRYVFHEKHSDLISLSPDKKTATRQLPMFSCDQGIAFSDQPLHDNEVFEVRIDQMMPLSMWRGSVDIGKAYTSAYHRPIVGKQQSPFL